MFLMCLIYSQVPSLLGHSPLYIRGALRVPLCCFSALCGHINDQQIVNFTCFFPFISQTYSPLFPCFSVRFFLLFRKQACSAPFHVFLLFPKQGSFMSVSFFHNVPCFRPIQLSLQLEKLLPYIGCRDNYGSIELKFCI